MATQHSALENSKVQHDDKISIDIKTRIFTEF